MSDWRTVNRAMWDERVPIHVASEFYDVEGFLAGRSDLRPFEPTEVGNVEGRHLLHLQCHFGLDTLSWARLGAQVTGLDFSAPAVSSAREIAQRAGLAAEFVQSDVYDAPAALGGRRFEVVYTGLGALNWLPDLQHWAEVVAQLLEPGGSLYLVEFHPFSDVFGDDDLTVTCSYFDRGPYDWVDPGSYADLGAPTVHNHCREWHHGLGETVSAVIAAGLRLEFLHEHDFTLFGRWPFLERGANGHYRLPAEAPALPLMYSLRATASWP